MVVSDVATLTQQVNNLLIFFPDIDKLLHDCNISRNVEEEDEVEKLLIRIAEVLQVAAVFYSVFSNSGVYRRSFDEILIKFDEMFEYFK